MGRHVVVAFVIVQIGEALSLSVGGSTSILGNHGVHPGLQILQDARVGVLVDGEAGTRVEAGEVENTLLDSCASNPGIQQFIQP